MMQIKEEGLTFDDVLLLPEYSDIVPSQVELKVNLTENIVLNIPMVSAAMDTVTESKLAIALARAGGIGVIHKNMSIQNQQAEVRRVKKYESVIVREPITIDVNGTIGDLKKLKEKYNISGVPVVAGKHLMGIVTNRDIRYVDNLNLPISKVMTAKDKLITAPPDTSLDKIHNLFRDNRIEKILLVDDQFDLKGMITSRDLQQSTEFPYACKDSEGRLLVSAAIGVYDNERAAALIESGVDIMTVDTAHGHALNVINCVKYLRKTYPNLCVIAGNVATAEGALALADAGADVVKVGIGPGSICTTRIVTGVGVPQLTAIANVKQALKKHKATVIADGGVRYSGDIAKALAAGADAVMLGNMFAGTDEAPGDLELYEGRVYKSYRGMGSIGAMGGAYNSKDRYKQDKDSPPDKLVPEGVEGRVPHRGALSAMIEQLMGGLRSSMGYIGCKTVAEIHSKARFIRLTSSALREGHVHDVDIVREPPNYPRF